jgi:hypothetical protein
LIDLHTHTTESDGTYTPQELVDAAVQIGLEALAITDHDTFAGYEKAVEPARAAGLRLICGIELSTALGNPKIRTVHLLGYFLRSEPSAEFKAWLGKLQAGRRDRNIRLAKRLQSLNVDVRIEEVESLGRSLAGRPHFARLLVKKGYASDLPDAFRKYLDESAVAYVDREEPSLEEAIRRVIEGGGIPSLAHPIRLGKRDHEQEEAMIASMFRMGLPAIEVYHSDHTAADSARYLAIAEKYGARATGGSDFHGDNKPEIQLGTGYRNNLNVAKTLLEALSA